jgi:hypothetical protein
MDTWCKVIKFWEIKGGKANRESVSLKEPTRRDSVDHKDWGYKNGQDKMHILESRTGWTPLWQWPYLTPCCLPSAHRRAITNKWIIFFFFWWNWGLNLGLHTSKAGMLEPCLQSILLQLF